MIRALCVDAAAAFADTAVELALVDVLAALAVHLRVTLRALAEGVIADLAGTAPGDPDRATAFRAQSRPR